MKPNIFFMPILFIVSFSDYLHAGENKLSKPEINGDAIVADSSEMMESSSMIDQDLNVYIIKLKEEGYIDDIPFDTKEVVLQAATPAEQLKLFKPLLKMKDEAYIDDIPFNTKAVFDKFCVPVPGNGTRFSCRVMN
jgi:hypothetical protein